MADISEEDLQKEIAAILEDADLSKTSVKKVRQELEKKLGCNLLSKKTIIDTLVMEFIENKKQDDDEDEEDEDEEEEDEEEDSDADKKKKRGSSGKKPPAKKSKKTVTKAPPKDDSEDEDSDASEPSKDEDSEEEYSPKKSSKAKPFKTRKLPPKKKKGSDSDSDDEKPKAKKGGAKRGGGYTKQMTLSKELAALVGQESMARHEVVKEIWAIIKERDLYDPNNKQFAICDDDLFKVIGVKRFRTFGMMKYLKNHFIS
ncbi:nucleolin [Harmonia axyridis]|uniref:nucleolin n=1 Tax=Harmonia axyridis TaxID=115357 RepID=UPI001E276846|nr:nucleolin [Harmonia axyridis]